jgi:CRISPR/Cas system-associated exonuclease Cas4 (RecB family)
MRRTVSYSRISTYRDCPQQYHYSYVERITPKKPSAPMFFGKDLHSLLEARSKVLMGDTSTNADTMFDNISKQYKDLPAVFQEMIGQDYLFNLRSILEDYCQVYDETDSKKIITGVEQKFELPLPVVVKGDRWYINGVIDQREETEEGQTILMDHKTFSRMPDAILMAMNTQACLYAKASQMLDGFLPKKMVWDYIKSTPAEYPVWLEKSQRFSTAASQKITPFSYMRALKSQGLERDRELVKYKNTYYMNIENYFKRVSFDIVPGMVESVWRDFIASAKDLAVNGEKNKVKNVSWKCSFCSFKDLCYTEFTGGDVEYTKERDFEKKKEEVTTTEDTNA